MERPVNPKAWTCSSLKQLQGSSGKSLENRYAGLTARLLNRTRDNRYESLRVTFDTHVSAACLGL
jgi:hypothetical protein